jgi:hypothetical protein
MWQNLEISKSIIFYSEELVNKDAVKHKICRGPFIRLSIGTLCTNTSKWTFDCHVLISNKNGTFQGVGGDKAFVGFAMKYFF